jgi:hypothetical protein
MANAPRLPGLAALLFVCAICFNIYSPGLSGGFVFDDHTHIVENRKIQLSSLSGEALLNAALSYPDPVFKRPLSMLSLALNHRFAELDPYYFKLTNLFIHLINGFLLYFLCTALFSAPRLNTAGEAGQSRIMAAAFVCSAAWLLAPINLTPVLYVIQRMSSLSALFVLIGLLLYVYGRLTLLRYGKGRTLVVLAYIPALLGAVLAKENGVLLPAYFLVLEWAVFRFEYRSHRDARIFNGLLLFSICAPLLAFVLIAMLNPPEWLSTAYQYRDFSMAERLLTEPRVIWIYLKMMLIPRPSEFGLFHDDLVISRGLFEPFSTLIALLGLLAALLSALLLYKKLPLYSFGVLFFLAAHSLESTFLPLEIAHEHRNYLASIGLFLPLAWYLFVPAPKHKLVYALRLALTISVALGAYITSVRADAWSDDLKHATLLVRFHPDSARSNYQLGSLYLNIFISSPGKYADFGHKARQHFLRAAELWPHNRAAYLLSSFVVSDRLGEAIDPAHLETAFDDLESRPVSDFAVSSVVSLIECQAQQHCGLDQETVFRFAERSASNPLAREKGRARILASSAQYAWSLGQLERAIELAEKAMQTYPDHLQHLLNLSMLYISKGRYPEASALLDSAQVKDRKKEFSDKIAYQRTLIPGLRPDGHQDMMAVPQTSEGPDSEND